MARLKRGYMLVEYTTRGGLELKLSLPSKKEVCSRCEGKGRHSNPSIDGNGITSSEWEEWDDESREAYMSGAYDVTCYECKGENVVDVVDEERLSKKQLAYFKLWSKQEEQRAQWEAEDRATSFWENGGRYE